MSGFPGMLSIVIDWLVKWRGFDGCDNTWTGTYFTHTGANGRYPQISTSGHLAAARAKKSGLVLPVHCLLLPASDGHACAAACPLFIFWTQASVTEPC